MFLCRIVWKYNIAGKPIKKIAGNNLEYNVYTQEIR